VRTPTDNFRRQHEQLAMMGGELLSSLGDDDAATIAQAAELRRKVARFSGTLKVHASMETDALYPRLVAHPDPAVRMTAQALLAEVKDLYAAFDEYARRYPDAAAIEAAPRAFRRETRRVLDTLWRRMCRENDELYPLADAHA
jgi:hypothetical protein